MCVTPEQEWFRCALLDATEGPLKLLQLLLYGPNRQNHNLRNRHRNILRYSFNYCVDWLSFFKY